MAKKDETKSEKKTANKKSKTVKEPKTIKEKKEVTSKTETKNNKTKTVKKDDKNTENKSKKNDDLLKKKTNSKNNSIKNKVTTVELNEKIQSIVSILFTVVIFIALFFLIFVLYNNYLKPKDKNLDKICKDYLPKDYNINHEMIDNFIKNARSVIYNFDDFELKNITDDEIRSFATYLIWGKAEEYVVCDDSDPKCLTTHMEMPYSELKKLFKNYLDIDDVKINFQNNYNDDDEIRLYQEGDKVVLSFSEFVYQSYIHNLVYEDIKEDKVTLVFALLNTIDDTTNYKYIGYKTITLKYKNKNFIIENIKTSLDY